MCNSQIKLTLLLIYILSAGLADAQSTIGRQLKMKPRDYATPDGTIARVGEYTRNDLQNIWMVFSDRDNNPTYTGSDGKTESKKMKYMQAFYVIGDEGDYIHVVKYEPYSRELISGTDYTLQKQLEDYGWAPKKKMLLWNNCLVDSVTKFSIKALTVTMANSFDHIAQMVKGKNLKLFNSPMVFSTPENEQDVRIFDFLYEFKKDDENNSVLIGRSDRVYLTNANSAATKIVGWISTKVIKEWKDRVTLEANWDEDAVKERQAKGVKVSVLRDEASAKEYQTTGSISQENTLWNDDKYNTDQAQAEQKRLPFFNSPNSNVVSTGYVTDIMDINGKTVIKADDELKLERAYNKAREENKKVNIIFIIDGSETLKDYELPIRQIIGNTANKLNDIEKSHNGEEAQPVTYKLGAVVYRDYSEKDCGEIIDFQSSRLTSNPEDVVRFFTNEVKFANCKNTGQTRAVYGGLAKALAMLENQNAQKQTNVLILIGAGGNIPVDPLIKKNDLVNRLKASSAALFAFQVKQPNGPAYEDFYNQLDDLIQSEADQIRQEITKDAPNLQYPEVKLSITNTHNLYKLKCPKRSPIAGALMFADKMQQINPHDLTEQIFAMLNDLKESQDQILTNAESKFKGVGKSDTADLGTLNYFKKINADVELLRKASFNNIQLFVEGYTPLTCSKLKNRLYKNCLFINAGELSDLIGQLNKLSDASENDTKKRQKLKDAFYEMLIIRIGKKEARNKMNTMTPEQILEMISGRTNRGTGSIFEKVHINDITNEKKVKKDDINEFYSDITSKIEALTKYQSSDKNFKNNDVVYFWVPEDLLP